MNCAACGFANPEGMKFCGQCAEALRVSAVCAECGFDNPQGFKFCGECATPLETGTSSEGPERDARSYTPKHLTEKILQSKSALEGERKQVTVLFADIKSSMDLQEGIDPEEWHRILDRFFQILAGGVHRFEGNVNQYTGDGIMALFGAPIAHEDHPHRACYAALHLRDELRSYADELRRSRGLSFSVRIGLNSGEVIVGKIGDDLRMDYTAQGHTVGLAARIEELAPPGTTYLTENTARRVEGFFELRDLGLFELKGAQHPIGVYELQGIGAMRTRLEVSRARGFSKFVGRVEESASLDAALARAAEGNGSVLGIVADAGVGKSRLCFEFVERCRARGVPVYESHCPAHGKTIPFLPVLELLRSRFGIGDRDSAEEARRKAAGTLLLLDEAFRDELPVLFDFLAIPDPENPAPHLDPEARQQRLFRLVRRLVQATDEPNVIFIDDLHWVDPGSDEFVAETVEAVNGTQTFFLLNFRPEYHARWGSKSYYQQIPLMPLGAEAIRELLEDLLGNHTSVAELPALVEERTGGNPFFIEEVVQGLVESGSLEGTRGHYRLTKPVEELAIPATVQAVLAARIDRLPEREKQVLQDAAVIGRKFSESILRYVVELPDSELAGSVSALQSSEFILEEALYPEAEYAFKHPLTQQVSLESQLSDRRERTHAAVARAIQELNPEKLDEQAALIAHHWEEAAEPLESSRWHRRAAEWSGHTDPEAASKHWRRICELLGPAPEAREAKSLALHARAGIVDVGWRIGLDSDELDRLVAEGRSLAVDVDDAEPLVRLLQGEFTIRTFLGEVNHMVERATEVWELVERVANPELRVGVAQRRAWAFMVEGRFEEAVRSAQEIIEEDPETPGFGREEGAGFNPYVAARFIHAAVLFHMGRLSEANPALEEVTTLVRAQGEDEVFVWMAEGVALRACLAGETGGLIERLTLSMDAAERIGTRPFRGLALSSLGQGHAILGRHEEGRRGLESGLAILRETKTYLFMGPDLLADLARACLGCGDGEAAMAAANEAVERARRKGSRYYEPAALLARAYVLSALEGPAPDVEKDLRQGLELARSMGARGWEPLFHEERARLARRLGDTTTYETELAHAHRLFVENGANPHAERIARELAS